MEVREAVDAVYRAESRRVFATLVRLPRLRPRREALHEAFPRGARAVGARRRSRQPARLEARLGGTLQGDRQYPPPWRGSRL